MGIAMSLYRVTPEELSLAEEDSESVGDLIDEAYERAEKDGSPDGYLDKAWAGLDYLLRAARVPVGLDDAIIYLDDEGQLLAWNARTVARMAQLLRSTPFDDLARHYDPVAMTEQDVYPGIIWAREGDEALDWLRDAYTTLVAFFDDAASRKCAVINHLG